MHLGPGQSADDFLTFMRYALPNNPKAGENWRETLAVSVLRVRELPTSTRVAEPYPGSVNTAALEGVVEAFHMRHHAFSDAPILISGRRLGVRGACLLKNIPQFFAARPRALCGS